VAWPGVRKPAGSVRNVVANRAVEQVHDAFDLKTGPQRETLRATRKIVEQRPGAASRVTAERLARKGSSVDENKGILKRENR